MRQIHTLRHQVQALVTLEMLGALALPAPADARSRLEPFGIAGGPDGNLWFTETATDTIGRITTSGRVTEFAL